MLFFWFILIKGIITIEDVAILASENCVDHEYPVSLNLVWMATGTSKPGLSRSGIR